MIEQKVFIGLVRNPAEGEWVYLPVNKEEIEEIINRIAPNGEEVFIPDSEGPINGTFYDIQKLNEVIDWADLKELDEDELEALFEYFDEDLNSLCNYFEHDMPELRIWNLRNYFPNYNYADKSEEQIWADLAEVWVDEYGYLGNVNDQVKLHLNYHSVAEQIRTEYDIHLCSNGIIIEVIG